MSGAQAHPCGPFRVGTFPASATEIAAGPAATVRLLPLATPRRLLVGVSSYLLPHHVVQPAGRLLRRALGPAGGVLAGQLGRRDAADGGSDFHGRRDVQRDLAGIDADV